jgi:uncharacterized protein HemX
MAYCPNCGSPIENNNMFCSTCGAKVVSTPPEPIPPAPAPMYREPVNNIHNRAKKNTILYVIIGILAAALIGLGVFFFIERGNLKTDISNLESDVAALQIDLAAKQANINSLQTQLANEKAVAAGLEEDLAEEQAKVVTIQGQLADTTNQLNTSRAEVTRLESELAASQSKIANLESELAAAMAEVASLQSQLAAIQAKYPLKDFPDYKTLSDWLTKNVCEPTLSWEEWYSSALKMQLLAAQDGYYVSACLVPAGMSVDGYIYVYNIALVGDTLYAFDPEIDKLYDWGDWGR